MHAIQYLSFLEVPDELERALDFRHLVFHGLLGFVHVALHQLVLAAQQEGTEFIDGRILRQKKKNPIQTVNSS